MIGVIDLYGRALVELGNYTEAEKVSERRSSVKTPFFKNLSFAFCLFCLYIGHPRGGCPPITALRARGNFYCDDFFRIYYKRKRLSGLLGVSQVLRRGMAYTGVMVEGDSEALGACWSSRASSLVYRSLLLEDRSQHG